MKLAGLFAVMMICSCVDDDDEESSVADPSCASGVRWAGGDEESPFMHPGRDCIGCHTERREGPRFTAAGTVHALLDEPADCYGVAGVRVTITDANSQSVQLVTNTAGNFFTETPIAMPIRVRLELEGRERSMTLTPSVGACATCHTETGTNNAPGRILAP